MHELNLFDIAKVAKIICFTKNSSSSYRSFSIVLIYFVLLKLCYLSYIVFLCIRSNKKMNKLGFRLTEMNELYDRYTNHIFMLPC